jgi:phenylalanyl-tRNA synthetase beta chain
MKLTLSLLKKFLELNCDPSAIINGLNQIGLEVEEVVNQAKIYEKFIVAEIISATPHPEAEKLRICSVNNGKEIIQIVCGASNARAGIKVVLAPIGTEIPANGLIIKKSTIRGIESSGMMCSAAELALEDSSDGIIELPHDFIVGELFAKQYGLDEIIIELSVTPNRGDCLGVYGIARDLAAAGYGNLINLETPSITGDFLSPIEVSISSPACSKYSGRYFKNVTNHESPQWLKSTLKNLGVKPISALVDITNYFTFTFGRPMHVYDANQINKIEVKQANENEEFQALNDKTYILKSEDLVISSNGQAISLAGIIGGKASSVSLSSKNIFLEIAQFNKDSVSKSARQHQIESDAKHRFERNTDSEFVATALALASKMILEICGGEPSQEIIAIQEAYLARKIDFPLASLKKYTGIDYEKSKVITILKNLGFQVKDNGDFLNLTIPSWRHDIVIKEDVIEEIARIDGYDKITATPLAYCQPKALDNKQKMLYKIARFPASLGLDEVITYSFMNSKKAALFSPLNPDLFIKNPISSELDYIRNTLLPNLLDAASRNQNRGISSANLFELASVFKGIRAEDQLTFLAGIRTNNFNEKDIHQSARKVDVFDAKSDCFAIIQELGLDPYKLKYDRNKVPTYYHPGRSAALLLGQVIIAYFGEIHPKIIKEYDLKNSAVGFEILIDNIPISKPKFGRKGNAIFSDFQEVERDFAFLVSNELEVDTILKSVGQLDKKLIKSVNIFDIFTGKNIEEGKKSIAFSVKIQANDRTLTDAEIEDFSQKIISHLVSNYQAVLRSC